MATVSEPNVVVVVGAGGELGRRVLQRCEAAPDIGPVVAIDAGQGAGDQVHDPRWLAQRCAGATTLVWLAPTTLDDPGVDGTGTDSVVTADPALPFAAAEAAGVEHLVVLSSALVYGAQPANTVPLTEDTTLRPDPSLSFATTKAELERRAGVWRREAPGRRSVALLRPAVAVSSETSQWFLRSPWSTVGMTPDDGDAPAQFLHLDDLADAVVLAARQRLDGALNVAPDGWISREELRALGGPARDVRVPARLAQRVARLAWRSGRTAVPPAVLATRRNPLVVANDRLRHAGWRPAHTNEEVYVAADLGGPLGSMNARRRQDVAFAAVGLVALAGLVVLLRRWRVRGR